MKKITSRKELNNSDFRISIGTFDKKNPKTVFMEESTYIIPSSDFDFKKKMEDIERSLRKKIGKDLLNFKDFEADFISILEVPYERMKAGKKSYLYTECHLRQKDGKPFDDIMESTEAASNSFTNILKSILADNGFSLSKNR